MNLSSAVLILVMMDAPLMAYWNAIHDRIVEVLILVMMDVPLMEAERIIIETFGEGLNPCYDGCTSYGVDKVVIESDPRLS